MEKSECVCNGRECLDVKTFSSIISISNIYEINKKKYFPYLVLLKLLFRVRGSVDNVCGSTTELLRVSMWRTKGEFAFTLDTGLEGHGVELMAATGFCVLNDRLSHSFRSLLTSSSWK